MQHRLRGVAGLERQDALGRERADPRHRPDQERKAVEQMDAHAGHAAGLGLLRRGAPVVERGIGENVVAVVAFGEHHGAELRRRHDLLQLHHRGPEPPVMPDAERDARLAACRDRGLRVLDGQREWLLAEHMLADGSRRFDLLACFVCGVASTTASIDLSASTSSYEVPMRDSSPWRSRAPCRARALRRARSASACSSRCARTSSLPHQPSPIIAALSMGPPSSRPTMQPLSSLPQAGNGIASKPRKRHGPPA